jgi:hypothetical protein
MAFNTKQIPLNTALVDSRTQLLSPIWAQYFLDFTKLVTSDTLLAINNLSDVANKPISLSNLGGSPLAGNIALTTVGTITTGTWNAGVIAGQYGGTGVANTGKTITLGGNFTTSGANSLTLTTSGTTNVTLPTTGTLVNTAVTTLSSLASIGTITTGTWNAGVIAGQYGGTGVANTGKTITLTNSVTLADNTYSPTINNTTNIDSTALSYGSFQYLRVGDKVTVSGVLDIDPTTAAGTSTTIGISLPLASNFANIGECAGIGISQSAGSGLIYADTTNDRARFDFNANSSSSSMFSIHFTYRIL